MSNKRLRIFQVLALLALAALHRPEALARVDMSVTIGTASPLTRERGGAIEDQAAIIWPPIDQPLDLRGGYRQRAVAVRARPPRPASHEPRLSSSDCQAAGAFILAGARARDRGVSGRVFMAQLRTDLMKLAAEPAARRWFLHSEREARLLHGAAKNIFARPQAPATHYREFVARCDAIRTSTATGLRN